MDGQIANALGNKAKSFWQKPEGKVGAVFATGLVIGLGYVLYHILPFLITMTTNIILLTLLIIGAVTLIFVAQKSAPLFAMVFKMAMRRLTGWFINLDPVSIIEEHVSDLTRKMMKMKEQVGNLRGQQRKLEDEIARNEAEIKQNLLEAKKAKEMGKPFVHNTRQAGRLTESNKKYTAMLINLKNMYTILRKMQETSQSIIKDYENLVAEKKREREVMMSSYSAFQSAKNILSGDPDKKELFDRAMESIQDDISMKLGEIENFILDSEEIINSIDIQNAVMSDKGEAMLREWEEKIPSLLLTEGSAEILELDGLGEEPEKIPVYAKKSTNESSKYDGLI